MPDKIIAHEKSSGDLGKFFFSVSNKYPDLEALCVSQKHNIFTTVLSIREFAFYSQR